MKHKLQQFYDYVRANPNQSELEIARGVGLKKTPYSRQILLTLVADGYLVRQWDTARQPPAYIFYVQNTEQFSDES